MSDVDSLQAGLRSAASSGDDMSSTPSLGKLAYWIIAAGRLDMQFRTCQMDLTHALAPLTQACDTSEMIFGGVPFATIQTT